jgi:adenosylcobyric acid synthase
MKTLMIQGTSSGAGKTTLVAVLCRIFSDKGYSVAPFKSQNMSNFSYNEKSFEISRAQAIQAVAARCQIIPEINPILLKPLGNYYSDVVVLGKYYKKMHAKDYYKKFVKTKGIKIALESLKRLRSENDIVIIEGAGSPVEINLNQYDIANMQIAEKANSPVLLVTDIDRGGSFASIVGTMNLLEERHKKLVKGFVINKFRGDINILKPGFRKLEKITKRKIYGTIPMTDYRLPEEDSLGVTPKKMKWTSKNIEKLDSDIDHLAKLVKEHLAIKKIEELIK